MGETGAFFKPFAHTPCTERILPEVHASSLVPIENIVCSALDKPHILGYGWYVRAGA